MRRLVSGATLAVCLLATGRTEAAEFFIEFDTLSGHTPGTGATLGTAVLSPLGWRSIGDPNGGRLTNRTGRTIKAIHIKVNNQDNEFRITAESAGRLFGTVWVKKDSSEAYFLDGNVPNLRAFWMRVPANSQAEIRKCDSQQICPFSGQVFEENPLDPTGEEWTKVKSSLEGITGKWRDLITACPSEWRDIRVYGEDQGGDRILFIADGQVLLYDNGEKSVSLLSEQDTAFSTVNRISYEHESFQLLRNGTVVQTIKVAGRQFEKVGRSSRANGPQR